MPSPIRLNKVLKELNISLDRAVEFLSSKKIEIEPRPTSKIDQDVYDLLLDEFQTDKSDKDKLEEINTKKRRELEEKQAEEKHEKETAKHVQSLPAQLRLKEIAIPVINSIASVSIAAIARGRNGSLEFSIVAMLSKPVASAAFAADSTCVRLRFGKAVITRIIIPHVFLVNRYLSRGSG